MHMPIEHFSKWLELVSLLNHINEGVAYAFLDWVLNRFGVPSKVFTYQGMKFRGEFQKLCGKTLIDHHTAS